MEKLLGARDVPGYEGLYLITTCGKVWSYRSQRFLKPYNNGFGYWQIILSKNGKTKHHKIHRLVAEAYIPNPEGKPEVNHIDECKDHNYIGNLEWVTGKENVRHSSQRGKSKTHSKIRCVETGEVYKNCADAARNTGIDRYCINCAALGKQKTAGGYHWERVLKNEETTTNQNK